MTSDNSPPSAPTRLVEATIRVLATRGPSEVKARSISSEAGLSTMGVYTHFGGVPELLQAVADEGFKRLTEAFKRVPVSDDPVADLCAMLLTCRDVAHSNPHLYDLMFGLSIDGRYSPSRGAMTPITEGQSTAFKATYAIVIEACTRLVTGKFVRKTDPALIAHQLWSVAHGFIMLELAGHFAHMDNPVQQIMVATTNNIAIGLGAKREKVEASTAGVIARWESLSAG
ncbi:TetR/AcrR family transcriptional regulator [Pseudomonas sp. RGM2987]|uniref:TetR/AcrR family transcriptional regulator n=1 Tax=Pseudomonas sp. RGM2987 TaxID=2930090 RepID=UPI001FD67541|nr:TetR/AcrR family transcriptional regulator [Pseudomonas sp. RGM2987]MCJ8206816.1 TetR/AcrR family transcriptional regulator [Pseudomonas sp. RGM2987]